MSEIDAFRSSVEQFLSEHRLSPTRFGIEAAGDPRFVFQLRMNREPRQATRDKVSQFMLAHAKQARAS